MIVDTPDIGEHETMDNILMDVLSHAVTFVFMINAKNVGGLHEERVHFIRSIALFFKKSRYSVLSYKLYTGSYS